jgi:Dullard-like phosphatase family protein
MRGSGNKGSVVPLNLLSEDNSINLTMQRIEIPSKKKRFWACLCRCWFKKIRTAEEITLLPPENGNAKKTLVLDLDETLVHSCLDFVSNHDLKISVSLDGSVVDIFVLLRPGVIEFIEKTAEIFEVVVFTASLKAYADPVIDFIDKGKKVAGRLFRTECEVREGNYIKNLSSLGRDLRKVVIVDNSPTSYLLHPDNGISISSWFGDKSDKSLSEIFSLLQQLSKAEDVPQILRSMRESCMEQSARNVGLTLEKFPLNRCSLNSPKPGESKFEFKEN